MKILLEKDREAYLVEKGQALEQELQQYGTQVKGYRSDASKMEDAESLIAQVVEDFGGVHIVVNNAGITKDTLLMRLTEEDFNRVIEVNLNSVFNMTKAVQRTFLKQRSGSIVNIPYQIGEQSGNQPPPGEHRVNFRAHRLKRGTPGREGYITNRTEHHHSKNHRK